MVQCTYGSGAAQSTPIRLTNSTHTHTVTEAYNNP